MLAVGPPGGELSCNELYHVKSNVYDYVLGLPAGADDFMRHQIACESGDQGCGFFFKAIRSIRQTPEEIQRTRVNHGRGDHSCGKARGERNYAGKARQPYL